MDIRINDLGAHVDKFNNLHSIGCTSILLEWMEDNSVLYRMLLDCGLKSTYKQNSWDRILDDTNILRIKNVIDDKVSGYNSGIQAMALSHCHEDHVGGYPWFYTYCKQNNIPIDGIPKLYTTTMTWKQFFPFQTELYDLFVEPARGSGYQWDKSIINEMRSYVMPMSYNLDFPLNPKPRDFEIRLKFIPAGHIVGSAMAEIDTLVKGSSIGKILYTGDTCFRNGGFLVDGINGLVSKKRMTFDSYNTIIMEAIYLRNRQEQFLKLQRPVLKELLENEIKDTITKGGNVVLLVYGVDRTANVLVALREIIDENKIGIDLKNRIYLDTSIGGKITNEYIKEFDSFINGNLSEMYSFFREELTNRANNGLGPSMLQSAKEKVDIYEFRHGIEQRKELIETYRNGGCIVVATSATMEGGTALMTDGYMHPDCWGSDQKHLFLIIGGAIPSTMAKRAMKQLEDTKGKFAEIYYQQYDRGENGEIVWMGKEKFKFTSRLKEFSHFSAHANYKELFDFKTTTNHEKLILTHIGGSEDVKTTQQYANNVFMSGIPSYFLKGYKPPLRGDVVILDGNNPEIVHLKENEKTITWDKEAYKMLMSTCISLKGDYNERIPSDVIKFLISHYNQTKK